MTHAPQLAHILPLEDKPDDSLKRTGKSLSLLLERCSWQLAARSVSEWWDGLFGQSKESRRQSPVGPVGARGMAGLGQSRSLRRPARFAVHSMHSSTPTQADGDFSSGVPRLSLWHLSREHESHNQNLDEGW